MRFPVVLFDLNGTLVDTFEDLTAALSEMLWAHGRPSVPIAAVRPWNGERLRRLLQLAFQATGPTPTDLEIADMLPQFREIYARHLGVRAHVYPGVTPALDLLRTRRVRMALLTNKPLGPSALLLDNLGLGGYFEHIIAGDGEVPRKPDPTGLLELMGRLGGQTDGTLLVGSSRIDLETARNAGVAVALVDHPPRPGQQGGGASVLGMGADYVLGSFANLPALVLGPQAGSTASA